MIPKKKCGLFIFIQSVYGSPKIHTHVKFNKRIYTLIIFLTLKHYKTTLTTENWYISLTLTHTFSQLHLRLLQPHKMYFSIYFWASFKTVMGPVINKMFSDRKVCLSSSLVDENWLCRSAYSNISTLEAARESRPEWCWVSPGTAQPPQVFQ